jgi:uncharacterized membrane protein YoaK (UPF0700 family)
MRPIRRSSPSKGSFLGRPQLVFGSEVDGKRSNAQHHNPLRPLAALWLRQDALMRVVLGPGRVLGAMVERSTRDMRIPLLLALTVVSGVTDAASYLGLGRVFTSNMTGNWVAMAFALTGAHDIPFVRLGLSFAGFLIGAAVAGQIARRPWRGGRKGWPLGVTVGLLFAASMQVVVTILWIVWPSSIDNLLAFLLATSMGCQGGAVRKLDVADLPTTVITSTVTGLALDSPFGSRSNTRWGRRLSALLAFFAGGLIGALIGNVYRPLTLLAGIAILVGVSIASGRLLARQDSQDLPQ